MRRFGYLISFIVAALLLQSCQQGQTEPCDEMPNLIEVRIVKLNPIYLDYVIAGVEKRNDSILFKIFGQEAACQELFLGTSPYIELPNRHYLIDWKWGIAIPNKNFLINVQWEDVENRQQEWNARRTKRIHSIDVASKCISVSHLQIDKYLHIAPPTEMSSRFPYIPAEYLAPDWMGKYHSLNDLDESQIEEYKKGVAYYDSLQNVYVERISKMILMGYFED